MNKVTHMFDDRVIGVVVETFEGLKLVNVLSLMNSLVLIEDFTKYFFDVLHDDAEAETMSVICCSSSRMVLI